MSDKVNGNWGGKRKGAGRPTKTETEKLKTIMDNKVDMNRVIETLYAMALDGDIKALTKLLEYNVGKPIDRVHTVTEDITDKKIQGAWLFQGEDGTVQYINGESAEDNKSEDNIETK